MRALLCALIITLLFSPVLFAQKDKKTIDLQHESFDVRDAMLAAAAKGKINLIIAPGIKGSLSINAKEQMPADAIKYLAAAVGCVVETRGDITVVVPKNTPSQRNLPVLAIPSDKKAKALIARSADVRVELLKLFKAAEMTVIIGRNVSGRCTIKLGEVPIKDVIETLAWVNDLSWTVLKEVVFIGSPKEVKAARLSFDAQNR